MAIKKFSEDNLTFDELDAWFNSAVKDGWVVSEVYPGHEGVETAAYLDRDGFKVMLMRRKEFGQSVQTYGELSIWGPDGLTIPTTPTYDFEAMKKAITSCPHCKAEGVKTSRINFAGRACEKCKSDPAFMAKAEPPGWAN